VGSDGRSGRIGDGWSGTWKEDGVEVESAGGSGRTEGEGGPGMQPVVGSGVGEDQKEVCLTDCGDPAGVAGDESGVVAFEKGLMETGLFQAGAAEGYDDGAGIGEGEVSQHLAVMESYLNDVGGGAMEQEPSGHGAQSENQCFGQVQHFEEFDAGVVNRGRCEGHAHGVRGWKGMQCGKVRRDWRWWDCWVLG
jgi:hypothetical protein